MRFNLIRIIAPLLFGFNHESLAKQTFLFPYYSDVTEETIVDLHAVEGLRGVFIASQVNTSSMVAKKFSMEDVISVITYDQGGQWQVLTPPELDDDGRPIYCQYVSPKKAF